MIITELFATLMNEIFTQQVFKLEYLLESYLFTQKFTNNTHIIGVRHDNRVEITNMSELSKHYFSQWKDIQLSEFAKGYVYTGDHF